MPMLVVRSLLREKKAGKHCARSRLLVIALLRRGFSLIPLLCGPCLFTYVFQAVSEPLGAVHISAHTHAGVLQALKLRPRMSQSIVVNRLLCAAADRDRQRQILPGTLRESVVGLGVSLCGCRYCELTAVVRWFIFTCFLSISTQFGLICSFVSFSALIRSALCPPFLPFLSSGLSACDTPQWPLTECCTRMSSSSRCRRSSRPCPRRCPWQ